MNNETYTLHVQKVVNLQIHYIMYMLKDLKNKQCLLPTHWALGGGGVEAR